MHLPRIPTKVSNLSTKELLITMFNFGIGIYNAYLNNKQVEHSTKVDNNQQKILDILKELKES